MLPCLPACLPACLHTISSRAAHHHHGNQSPCPSLSAGVWCPLPGTADTEHGVRTVANTAKCTKYSSSLIFKGKAPTDPAFAADFSPMPPELVRTSANTTLIEFKAAYGTYVPVPPPKPKIKKEPKEPRKRASDTTKKQQKKKKKQDIESNMLPGSDIPDNVSVDDNNIKELPMQSPTPLSSLQLRSKQPIESSPTKEEEKPDVLDTKMDVDDWMNNDFFRDDQEAKSGT